MELTWTENFLIEAFITTNYTTVAQQEIKKTANFITICFVRHQSRRPLLPWAEGEGTAAAIPAEISPRELCKQHSQQQGKHTLVCDVYDVVYAIREPWNETSCGWTPRQPAIQCITKKWF